MDLAIAVEFCAEIAPAKLLSRLRVAKVRMDWALGQVLGQGIRARNLERGKVALARPLSAGHARSAEAGFIDVKQLMAELNDEELLANADAYFATMTLASE